MSEENGVANIGQTVSPKIDKEALEARNALEAGIQALYVGLITGDHQFQGTYIPTMVDLLEQWLDVRDRLQNPNGQNMWFVLRLQKMISNLAMEKDISTDVKINRDFYEGRFGTSYKPSPKCMNAALNLMTEVVNKLITEDQSDSQRVLKANADRTNIRILRQIMPQLNLSRSEAVYVDKQQNLINNTSRMMRPITEIVFTNNLVKLKDLSWGRSEYAKSLDPKRTV